MGRRFIGTFATFTSPEFRGILLQIVFIRNVIGALDEFGPFTVNEAYTFLAMEMKSNKRKRPDE